MGCGVQGCGVQGSGMQECGVRGVGCGAVGCGLWGVGCGEWGAGEWGAGVWGVGSGLSTTGTPTARGPTPTLQLWELEADLGFTASLLGVLSSAPGLHWGHGAPRTWRASRVLPPTVPQDPAPTRGHPSTGRAARTRALWNSVLWPRSQQLGAGHAQAPASPWVPWAHLPVLCSPAGRAGAEAYPAPRPPQKKNRGETEPAEHASTPAQESGS